MHKLTIPEAERTKCGCENVNEFERLPRYL